MRAEQSRIGAIFGDLIPGESDMVLSGDTAAFTLTVPRGRGTLQAFAEFTVPYIAAAAGSDS